MSTQMAIGVSFPRTLPRGNGHRYQAEIRYKSFPHSGKRKKSDPVPTFSPLPFLTVTYKNAGRSVRKSILLDTGAQISIINTKIALALGLDKNGNGSVNDEAISRVPVGGVGGSVVRGLHA